MPIVPLASGSVHYSEAGSGPTLLLLHANPGDSRDFDAVIPSLAKHFRVLALDWPGYGRSPMPANPEAVTVLTFEQVLIEFIEAMNLKSVSLLGNSVGGNVAARFAARFPENIEKLVLVAPGGFTPQNLITRSFCRLQGSLFALPPALWARFYLRKNTPITLEMLDRAKTLHSQEQCLRLNRSIWRSFTQPESDVRTLGKLIQAPTLLVFGKKDPAISAKQDGREAAHSISHATSIILNCGHAPFAEIPEEFLRHTVAFLAPAVRSPSQARSLPGYRTGPK